jgi:hypothetical protein
MLSSGPIRSFKRFQEMEQCGLCQLPAQPQAFSVPASITHQFEASSQQAPLTTRLVDVTAATIIDPAVAKVEQLQPQTGLASTDVTPQALESEPRSLAETLAQV